MHRNNLTQVVSQAAIHLHNELSTIGTALFDCNGSVLFSNNAQHYVNENTLAGLVADCLSAGRSEELRRVMSSGVTVRLIPLSDRYVFVVCGYDIKNEVLDRFVISLQNVLPKTPLVDH